MRLSDHIRHRQLGSALPHFPVVQHALGTEKQIERGRISQLYPDTTRQARKIKRPRTQTHPRTFGNANNTDGLIVAPDNSRSINDQRGSKVDHIDDVSIANAQRLVKSVDLHSSTSIKLERQLNSASTSSGSNDEPLFLQCGTSSGETANSTAIRRHERSFSFETGDDSRTGGSTSTASRELVAATNGIEIKPRSAESFSSIEAASHGSKPSEPQK
jgi:hypothetical protein